MTTLSLKWEPEGNALHARADGLLISVVPVQGGWMAGLCDDGDVWIGGQMVETLEIHLADDYPDAEQAQAAAERLYREVRQWLRGAGR